MPKPHLYYIAIGSLLAIAIGIHSCKKVNGIDNNQVIETPYSLYFTDISGVLFNSNDGVHSQRLPFPADGYPCRALCVSYNNFFMAKYNLYISANNAVNFNHTYDSLGRYPDTTCNGLAFDLNQSMIINIPDWNMIFCASTEPANTNNFLGVRLSISAGDPGTWWSDLPDSLHDIGGYGAGTPIRITSFTLMTNGVLAGYDAHHNRNFYRIKGSLWNECTANPDSIDWFLVGAPLNHSGIPLPHRNMYNPPGAPPSVVSDTLAHYSYGHYNTQLIAIDQKNCNGGNTVYYSNDTGRNWAQFPGGMPSVPLLCIASPFEEICLVGTAGAGVYILNTNTNTWQANNKGLASNASVRSIAFKQNQYKNGKITKYIYLATDQGIYESTDMGNNWTRAFQGNFTAIY